ncbi:MAG: adenylate cyclase [Acidobacteria bacterium]|nr:adenylate cyclase [Acidobacteriota bacterium]
MPSAQTSAMTRRIGAYLSVPASSIEWAISVQNAELASGKVVPIGEILIEREQVTREDLLTALEHQRIDRLRRCALFSGLSDADLARISENSEEITLSAGQELLKQGQHGDSIYTLVSGRLLMYRRLQHLEGVPVGVAVPGDSLGDAEYFSNGTHGISACAVEPALALRIRYEFLRDCTSLSSASAPGRNEDLFSLQGWDPTPGSAPESRDAPAAAAQTVGADTVTERVVQRATQALDADRALIFLLDSETGGLFAKMARDGECRTFRVRPGAGIVGFVARSGELVNVPEAYLDARFDPEIDVWSGYWTRTLLAGPIRNSAGAILGVLQVVNKHKGSFTQDDEVLFRAFGHQAASALRHMTA